ncbi:gamma-glutamyltransferase [Acetobacter sp. TBRC 12305]|uniref:Gamma-glutamyltransferase n=1 Tax=Acetobacter garciniae TaxID=2817435 RepID=A0A939HNM2_9PROT|nr:gamma-glutamyltransferase [Acetobacter garciniae]MBO1325094.1 gamma-glutamyltransferase [Acetobacter garciniae]MBX0344935.1 gamma-glutamyltransferase [Acetobacter garciniae]
MKNFTTRPELSGTFGAISATHWLGAAVGSSVLERGGNAFDAAVACGFVLQIVEPHLNGPGGDVVMIVKAAGEDAPVVICGQGVAPQAATMQAFDALNLKMIPGTGLLPAVVPGAFDAWMLLLRDYGTWTVEDVLAYAISYAEKGFPLLSRAVASIVPVADLFREEWPSSAEIWLPGNALPRPREIMFTPAIANTYKRIIHEAKSRSADRIEQIEAARAAFYSGFVAEAIDSFYRKAELFDTTGRRNGGLLRGSDMANWRATKEKSVSLEFRGLRVHKAGPWSQGPVFLQQLSLLQQFDLERLVAVGGDQFIHMVVECAKLAFADREAFYGDPAATDIPIETLLSDEYARERAKLVGPNASLEWNASYLQNAAERLGVIAGLAGSEVPAGPGGGEVTFAAVPEIEGDTVHLDIADRFGNVISATPSGGWLQSSPAVPGLGFSLSTRGQMFWLDERLPSCLRPGTRPRTTLTPTLVTREAEGMLAFGTPGGDQQDQWPLTVFLRHVLGGQGLQEAIDGPMFHSKHWPSSFYPRDYELGRILIEDRFGTDVAARLSERGHKVSVDGSWSLGRICAVERRAGLLFAGATPRHMQSYAIVR